MQFAPSTRRRNHFHLKNSNHFTYHMAFEFFETKMSTTPWKWRYSTEACWGKNPLTILVKLTCIFLENKDVFPLFSTSPPPAIKTYLYCSYQTTRSQTTTLYSYTAMKRPGVLSRCLSPLCPKKIWSEISVMYELSTKPTLYKCFHS